MWLYWCIYTYKHKSKKIKITAAGDDAAARQAGEVNNEVIFNNYVPFTECISEINNTQVDNIKKISVMWCQCIILSNIVIIVYHHQDVYGNTIEINQL